MEKVCIYNVVRAKASCVPQQKACAMTKALKKARATPNEHYMKVKGVVQDKCWEMLRDLHFLSFHYIQVQLWVRLS
jgi:predicted metal-binding transcription factor (methanogenesis marker protein 9)